MITLIHKERKKYTSAELQHQSENGIKINGIVIYIFLIEAPFSMYWVSLRAASRPPYTLADISNCRGMNKIIKYLENI